MDRITIHPPFLLAESQEDCWKCGQSCAVYAFIANEITDDEGGPAFEGPYFLRNIEDLPEILARSLPQRQRCLPKSIRTLPASPITQTRVSAAPTLATIIFSLSPVARFFRSSPKNSRRSGLSR